MTKHLTQTPTGHAHPGLGLGLVAFLLLAFALSSCNTVEGMGEDVSAAGGAVSDTADDVEDEM